MPFETAVLADLVLCDSGARSNGIDVSELCRDELRLAIASKRCTSCCDEWTESGELSDRSSATLRVDTVDRAEFRDLRLSSRIF